MIERGREFEDITASYEYNAKNSIQEAIDFGIDVTLLYESVQLSPTQRMEIHRQMLEFLEEARKNLHRMGRPYYYKDKVVL
ncbi:MAG: hypothetical protein AB1422_04520 [bacterium]